MSTGKWAHKRILKGTEVSPTRRKLVPYCTSTSLWGIHYETGGETPDVCKGFWTSEAGALTAIANYNKYRGWA